MQSNTSGKLHWLWLSAIVFGFDQLVKWWVIEAFSLYQQLPVLPFFSLTLAYNTGAAFSFLSDASGWQRWFLSGVAIIVSIMLVGWLKQLRSGENWQACSLSLILGGALGNLIDRLLHGHVTDFLLFYYKNWYFPAFNLADTAITVGAAMLILDMFRSNPSVESSSNDK
ncbi:signal peptidase II [Endozoicomonas sp. GU-1]|uniref:signal peptidase II n=1 Tax=Endozoicomonas sp. GU-1 TaxID=3009078 RepID=UPI0022B3F7B9|nr:signal peptidase II [Endozoicomonas sp. GU-1]WBA82668.1 signal peptidase II [Endozoicomonas sp. GU-1]WBA85600.1 signal peptidase II [Endozoicomonas sp. GU-1]